MDQVLNRLHLRNYRGFRNHVVEFSKHSLLVGPNNAGKTTISEALRFVALLSGRSTSLKFVEAPSWTGQPKQDQGVVPSLKRIPVHLENVCHRYGDPPATITAHLADGISIRIFVHPEEGVFAQFVNSEQEVIRGKSQIRLLHIPKISLMPPVGRLARNERSFYESDYLRETSLTHLAPLHFRNTVRAQIDFFEEFKSLVTDSWPGIDLSEPAVVGQNLTLDVREPDFVTEVANYGDGLQIWLQIMFYLATSAADHTIILDEPDVFLHADLQRRLARLLRQRDQQTIIASHSAEFIAEATPNELILVNRKSNSSKPATQNKAIQKALDSVGGFTHLDLVRLATARKCIAFEGNDLGILRLFHSTLFPKSKSPLDIVPNWPLHGWENWREAYGLSKMLQDNVTESAIQVYCLLDRDYRSEEQVQHVYTKAAASGLSVHIWSRKEIENYLLVPEAISRLINRNGGRNDVTSKEIEMKLSDIYYELKEVIAGKVMDRLGQAQKGMSPSLMAKKANEYYKEGEKSLSTKIAALPGKEAFARLSNWSKSTYNVSLSTWALAREIRKNEIVEEIKDVLSAIERSGPIDQ